jgi:hypothetical protein
MKKLITILGLLVSFNPTLFSQKTADISSYVKFLNDSKLPTAKQYILDLFKQYDIVVLCERWHQEFTQYNLITDIIQDNYFKENVGNVFIEAGVSTLNPKLNYFLNTNNIPDDSVENTVTHFQQNCDYYPLWEKYNFHYFLSSVYHINNNSKAKISVFPSDMPMDWSQINDSAAYSNYFRQVWLNRDSIVAKQIIDTYGIIKTKHKKALVIMNYRHAFNKNIPCGENTGIKNVSKYLFDYFGNRIANVLINNIVIDINGNPSSLIQNGKWDAAFKIADKTDVGFNFDNTVFGKDSFDLWVCKNKYKYQDIFNGFIFYQPIENHKLIENYNGLISKDFENEFIRRWNIASKIMKDDYPYTKPNSEKSKELIAGFNKKDESGYPNIDTLIKIRDKYLPLTK